MHRLRLLVFVLPAALFLAGLAGTHSAAGADATLSVAPASQTVDPGAPVSVEVKQNAPVAVLGVQTSFNFNAGVLQIVSVTQGSAYAGSSFLMGVAPQTKAEAIAEANQTGILKNVSSFFIPPGQVPAGEATFFTVAMQATVGGTSEISLTSPEMYDTGSNSFTITLNGGTVSVTGATATPSPTACPGCTPTPSPSPKPATPTPTPPPPLEAILRISPTSTLVPPGAEFSVTVMQKSNRTSTGAQTDLKFDPAVVQVVDVTKGRPYQAGQLIMGIVPDPPATPNPKAATIAQSNASGTLENVAAFFVPGSCPPSIPCSVSPGEAAFLTVKLKGIADGRSTLELANVEIIDELGNGVGVGANNGEVVIQTGAPLPGQQGQALGAVRLPAGGGDAGSDGGFSILALAVAFGAVTAGGIFIGRLAARR